MKRTVEDLLKAMLGGAGSEDSSEEGGGDPLAALLSGMLGGGTGDAQDAVAEAGASSGLDAGDLLGALIGGSGQQGGGGLGGMLGALMGGMDSSGQSNPLLGPIAGVLSDKVGLSPEISQMVVAFALDKLLGGGKEKGDPRSRAQGMEDILAHVDSEKGMDADYLRTTGMAEELAQQTGLDEDTATASLQEAFTLLGGSVTQVEAAPEATELPQGGLDDLLGNWDK
jgi:hypothetical protein